MEKVFEIYIRTTPERLWEAITDSEIRSKYHFGNRITSDWNERARRGEQLSRLQPRCTPEHRGRPGSAL